MHEQTINLRGGLETDTSSVDWVIDQYFEEYSQKLTNGRKHEFEAFTDQGAKLDYVISRLGVRDPGDGHSNESDLLDAVTLRSLHAVRWIEQKMKMLERGESIAYDMYPSIDYWANVDKSTEVYLRQLMDADYVTSAISLNYSEYDETNSAEWQHLYQVGDCRISKCVTPVMTKYVVHRAL